MSKASREVAGTDESHSRPKQQPLGEVVTTVVHKWFQDTLQAAKQGDSEQMLMLSSMLEAGYGCSPDRAQAKIWQQKAQTTTQQPKSDT